MVTNEATKNAATNDSANSTSNITPNQSPKKGVPMRAWTKKEDKIVRQIMRRKDLSLPEAFAECAKLVGRTPGSVSGHYYDFIRRKPVVKKVAKKGIKRKVTKRITKDDSGSMGNVPLIIDTHMDMNPKQKPVKNNPDNNAGGVSLSVEILHTLIDRLSREDKKFLILSLLK